MITPFTSKPFRVQLPFGLKNEDKQPEPEIPKPKELDLMRFQNYAADFSGCGHWRVLWPEQVMNAHGKAVSHTTTVMNLDPRYYTMTKAVRIQRQATRQQLEFAKFLKEVSKQNGMRMIYEIDDICFIEDIPEYNKFKPAFANPEIRESACAIMELCDEITVTCDFMKDYYKSKTNNKNVTVVPNFMPKFWIGNHCDMTSIMNNFDRNKKKPRVLYTGSGAHFDVDNRTGGYKDDFFHVNDAIRRTVDKFQWVFLGAYPLPLTDLIRSGKIEFHPWSQLYNYGESIAKLNASAMIAPLQNNTFNKAKSDLKYIEACAFGIPVICQDLVTYANAPYKFTTGDEMIDQLNKVLADAKQYKSICKKARQYAETRWLETDENIDCFVEMYSTPYGDKSRKNLSRFNKE